MTTREEVLREFGELDIHGHIIPADTWNMADEIMRLRKSYRHLASHLQQCVEESGIDGEYLAVECVILLRAERDRLRTRIAELERAAPSTRAVTEDMIEAARNEYTRQYGVSERLDADVARAMLMAALASDAVDTARDGRGEA